MTNTIEALVLSVIETFTVRVQVAATDRLEELGLDSLDQIQLAIDLEGRFGITIADEEFTRWATVGDVVALVQAKTGVQHPPLEPRNRVGEPS